MKKLTCLFFGHFSCFLFFSCEKSWEGDCSQENKSIPVYKIDNHIVSTYSGSDKLTFVNTVTQQKLVFESEGIDTTFELDNVAGKSEDCPRYIKYEKKTFFFKNKDSLDMIKIEISANGTLSINFKNDVFNTYTHLFSSFHFDSITIQNNIYQKVRKVSQYGYLQDFYNLYYSMSHGIIRFKLTNGEIWDLLEKE